MAWEKDVNNPRNRALKSNRVLSPASSLHPRTLSWEGVLPGKRRATELSSDSEQAFATKKRRRSPKPPIDDLSYEPSQSVPSQLHHRVQPVRAVSPAKPKTKDVKRRIVSDNESDSLNSISRRSSAPTVGSDAHDGPGYKRATARRSGLATRRLSSALGDGESGQFPDGKAENTTSGNESEQPKRRIKVGPPGPRAKRSLTKVGPPIGKPRAVPPKSHKVGPPIGKSKSVAPASTQSQRHHSTGDEDVDDDSLCEWKHLCVHLYAYIFLDLRSSRSRVAAAQATSGASQIADGGSRERQFIRQRGRRSIGGSQKPHRQ